MIFERSSKHPLSPVTDRWTDRQLITAILRSATFLMVIKRQFVSRNMSMKNSTSLLRVVGGCAAICQAAATQCSLGARSPRAAVCCLESHC